MTNIAGARKWSKGILDLPEKSGHEKDSSSQLDEKVE